MGSDAVGGGDLERSAKRGEIGCQRRFKRYPARGLRANRCIEIAGLDQCGAGGVQLSAGPFAWAGFQSRVQPGCERNVL